MSKTKKKESRTLLLIVISLTLGLAPFYPEPHVLGKVKWILGGAVGMQPMDWFDFFLHGTPWILLLVSMTLDLKRRLSS